MKILVGVLAVFAVVGVSALMVVALNSCGGEEAETPMPVATETPAEVIPTPAEATVEPGAVDDSWERIQAAGRLLVGTSADYPPFEWYVAEGQIDGFDIALMDEIGRRLGVQVVYADYPFDALASAAQAGLIDVAIAAISKTREREAYAGFSNVYLVGEGAALAQQAANITLTAPEDITRYKVGVQRNSVYKTQIQKQLIDTGKMSPDQLFAYEKAEDAIRDLKEGRLDLVVMDSQPAQSFVDQGGVKLIAIGSGKQYYAIALPKGAQTLKAEIDRVIIDLFQDGTIAALSARYLGSPTLLPTPTPAPTSAPAPTGAPAPTATCTDGMALVKS
jgi:polar amino acid transport system substrate-binding protein